MESITPVVEYVESQAQRALKRSDINDSELIGMLSGSGGTQVDVAFYIILDSTFMFYLFRSAMSLFPYSKVRII